MIQLKLSTKPLFALVDDDVHDRVFGSKWYATRRKSQAAEAYDNAARSMHGECARTNREMGLLPCS